MGEGTFLLLYGALFGVPLLIAFIGFGIFMIGWNKELDEREKFYDELAKEREEREHNGE